MNSQKHQRNLVIKNIGVNFLKIHLKRNGMMCLMEYLERKHTM
ncbi:Uncharacterised protein [Klebsiella pneumoniae]|nr:Uncharacterised protein [Klebsiella pneumoniae]